MRASIRCLCWLLCASGALAGRFTGVALAPDGVSAWAVFSYADDNLAYHTTNFGVTWQSSVISPHYYVEDVECWGPRLVWASGYVGAIYHSPDSGLSWQRQNLGGPFSANRICMLDSLAGWAVGDHGPMLRTTNGGDSWNPVSLPERYVTRFIRFQGGSFSRAGQIWVAAGRVSGGDTWLGGQGYIVRSTDNGDSWTLSRSDSLLDFFDVYFTDTLHGCVVGGEDSAMTGVVLATSDGGMTWHQASVPAGTGFLRGVDFAGGLHGWACGEQGCVVRTTDGGWTWEVCAGTQTSAALRDVEFADTLRGIACGDSAVIATTDGGRTWSRSLSICEEAGTLESLLLSAGATFVRSLPEGSAAFDAMGRRVRDPKPGVYFVRDEGRGTGDVGSGRMRKVILQR